MSFEYYITQIHAGVFGSPGDLPDWSEGPVQEDFTILNGADLGAMPADFSAASLAAVRAAVQAAVDSKCGSDAMIVEADLEGWEDGGPDTIASQRGALWWRKITHWGKARKPRTRWASYSALRWGYFTAIDPANEDQRRTLRANLERQARMTAADDLIMVDLFLYDDTIDTNLYFLEFQMQEAFRLGRRPFVLHSPFYVSTARADLVDTPVAEDLDLLIVGTALRGGADVVIIGQVGASPGQTPTAWQTVADRYAGYKVPSAYC